MNRTVTGNQQTQGQAVETHTETVSVTVRSEVDKMLLETAQLIIDSELTDGQKMLRIYDIFESTLQEYNRAGITLEKLNDDCNVDDKKMSADMTRAQSKLNNDLRRYIKNLRGIIQPLSECLHDSLMYEKIPESYRDQLQQHYRNLQNWDADIRSRVIRRLQELMRGFKFHEKKRD